MDTCLNIFVGVDLHEPQAFATICDVLYAFDKEHFDNANFERWSDFDDLTKEINPEKRRSLGRFSNVYRGVGFKYDEDFIEIVLFAPDSDDKRWKRRKSTKNNQLYKRVMPVIIRGVLNRQIEYVCDVKYIMYGTKRGLIRFVSGPEVPKFDSRDESLKELVCIKDGFWNYFILYKSRSTRFTIKRKVPRIENFEESV